MVLSPVMCAEPEIPGMIASYSPTVVSSSTVPVNVLPMKLSWTKGSPMPRSPLAARWARRAEVPVPHGERSIISPAITHPRASLPASIASPVHIQ